MSRPRALDDSPAAGRPVPLGERAATGDDRPGPRVRVAGLLDHRQGSPHTAARPQSTGCVSPEGFDQICAPGDELVAATVIDRPPRPPRRGPHPTPQLLRPLPQAAVEAAGSPGRPTSSGVSSSVPQQRANRLRRTFKELMTRRGADLRYGRTFLRRFREAGLAEGRGGGHYPRGRDGMRPPGDRDHTTCPRRAGSRPR